MIDRLFEFGSNTWFEGFIARRWWWCGRDLLWGPTRAAMIRLYRWCTHQRNWRRLYSLLGGNETTFVSLPIACKPSNDLCAHTHACMILENRAWIWCFSMVSIWATNWFQEFHSDSTKNLGPHDATIAHHPHSSSGHRWGRLVRRENVF